MGKQVYWTTMMERAMLEQAVDGLLSVAMMAGHRHFNRIRVPYARTDWARNEAVKAFLGQEGGDTDTLVMLDADHAHPADIVERLVAHDVGVVGAAAFRRSEPYDLCAFARGPEGGLCGIFDWDQGTGLVPCTIVGTGAIAIQRWVFRRLDEAGFGWPYFRYEYPGENLPTEDIYFGLICEKAGIPHHVDLSLETPHISAKFIGERTFRGWVKRNVVPEPEIELDTETHGNTETHGTEG